MKNALRLLQLAENAFPISEKLPGASQLPRHGLLITEQDGARKLTLNLVIGRLFTPICFDETDLERDPEDLIEEIKTLLNRPR